MYSYPPSLSDDAAQNFLACLSGQQTDHTVCAHACWEVIGYANSQCEQAGLDPMEPCPWCPFPDAGKMVVKHHQALKSGLKQVLPNVNWQQIVQMALAFLAQIASILVPGGPTPVMPPKP